MDIREFREALGQQGLSLDTVRESLRRQQLMMRLLQYKVKPRRVSDEEVQAAYANMTRNGEYEVRARDIFISSPDGAAPAKESAARAKADSALRRIQTGRTSPRSRATSPTVPRRRRAATSAISAAGRCWRSSSRPLSRSSPARCRG